jgi:hypothetical protein
VAKACRAKCPIIAARLDQAGLALALITEQSDSSHNSMNRHSRIEPMSNDVPDRDTAFRNLIKAAWHFLDATKGQRDLKNMEKYGDLARATNEAMQANAKP